MKLIVKSCSNMIYHIRIKTAAEVRAKSIAMKTPVTQFPIKIKKQKEKFKPL